MIYLLMILGGYISLVAFCFFLLHHLKKQARLLQVMDNRIVAYKKRLSPPSKNNLNK